MNSFFKNLRQQQKIKKSFLCVGLDPHLDKLPLHMRGDLSQVLPFLQQIVASTLDLASCYKPQIAYFSAYGLERELELIIQFIKDKDPHCPVILDAKRNDIGSTADMYALEAFERYGADAVTVSPYMGGDTIEPFSRYSDKGVFVLGRTSNPGSGELQGQKLESGDALFESVAQRSFGSWNKNQNVGLVVGATVPEELATLREAHPDGWFLVPGVGAQGGDLQTVLTVSKASMETGGVIINSSRAIIYAGNGHDYGNQAHAEAQKMVQGMASFF